MHTDVKVQKAKVNSRVELGTPVVLVFLSTHLRHEYIPLTIQS